MRARTRIIRFGYGFTVGLALSCIPFIYWKIPQLDILGGISALLFYLPSGVFQLLVLMWQYGVGEGLAMLFHGGSSMPLWSVIILNATSYGLMGILLLPGHTRHDDLSPRCTRCTYSLVG